MRQPPSLTHDFDTLHQTQERWLDALVSDTLKVVGQSLDGRRRVSSNLAVLVVGDNDGLFGLGNSNATRTLAETNSRVSRGHLFRKCGCRMAPL
jgi:ribosomal protein S5